MTSKALVKTNQGIAVLDSLVEGSVAIIRNPITATIGAIAINQLFYKMGFYDLRSITLDSVHHDAETIHHEAVVIHHPEVSHSVMAYIYDWIRPEYVYQIISIPYPGGYIWEWYWAPAPSWWHGGTYVRLRNDGGQPTTPEREISGEHYDLREVWQDVFKDVSPQKFNAKIKVRNGQWVMVSSSEVTIIDTPAYDEIVSEAYDEIIPAYDEPILGIVNPESQVLQGREAQIYKERNAQVVATNLSVVIGVIGTAFATSSGLAALLNNLKGIVP